MVFPQFGTVAQKNCSLHSVNNVIKWSDSGIFDMNTIENNILKPNSGEVLFDLARDTDPYAAVGRAVVLLMQYDSFGALPFRHVTSLITGQVNREHYFFVNRNGKPTGFLGWAYCSEAAGEAWLTDNDVSSIGDGKAGDCVVFNTWVTDGPDMNSYVVSQMRPAFKDKTLLFARRRYANGRTRPIRIRNTRQS